MTSVFLPPVNAEPVDADRAAALATLSHGEIAARRRAFVLDWINSRSRSLQVLGAGALLFLPLLSVATTAEAQAAAPVPVGSINGVAGATLNADGSVQLTLSNGQVIAIPAAEVTVLADGTLALSAVAAEYVGALAGIGTAVAGGVGATALAAGGAGLAVVAGLAGGSSGGDPAPTVTVALASGGATLNNSQVAGTITVQGVAPPDSLVTVTIGGVEKTLQTDETGAYSIDFAAGEFPSADGTFDIEVKANEVDADGLPVGDPLATSTLEITVDTIPPTVTIDALPFGAVLNIADSETQQTITGTVSGNDTVPVTVTLIDSDGAETVLTAITNISAGTWSAIVTTAQMQALAQGTADVRIDASDAAGNDAPPFFFSFTVDTIAPFVTIDDVTGNNELTLANKGQDVTVSGTTDAEPGTFVTVIFNGTPLAPAPVVDGAPGPNTWTTTIPGALTDALEDEDGVIEEYTLTAQATDAANNTSPVVSATITTDFSAPTIAFDTVAGDDIINAAEAGGDVTITGTSAGLEEGRVVTVTLNGVTVGTDAVDAAGNFTVTLLQADIPGNGSYTLTASATNLEGTAAVPAPREITVDTALPVVTITGTVSGDDAGAAFATDDVINIVERVESLTVNGTIDKAGDVTLEFGGVTETRTVEAGAWSITLTPAQVTAFVDGGGALTLTATAVDTSLNPSAAPATRTLTADLAAPTITLDAQPFFDAFLNGTDAAAPQTISGTAPGAEGQEVTVTITDGTTTVTLTPTADGGGAWTTPFTAAGSGLDEGLITVSATVSDAAGNPAAAPATASFTLDTIAPVVTITTIAGDGIINIAEQGTDGITVTGTTDASEEGRTVTVTVDGGAGGSNTVGAGGAWSVFIPAANLAGLGDTDTPDFVASITDLAGNTGTSAAATATVDFTRPTVTLDAVATDDIINAFEAGNGFTLSGTTTGVAEGTVVTVAFGGLALAPEVQADGSWSIILTGTDVTGQVTHDTPVTITANVTNDIGNPALEASRDVPVDLVAPTVTFNPRPFGDVLNADDAADPAGQTISGTATGADGENIEIRLFSGGVEQALRTVPTDPVTGAWSANFTSAELQALPQGELAINARAVDAAGNVRNVTVSSSVDTIAPDVEITSVQSGGEDVGAFINIAERDAGVTVTGTTDDPANVTVTITSGAFSAVKIVTPDAEGNWTAVFEGIDGADDLAGLLDGAVSITAASTDTAGNTGNATPEALTADLTPPVIFFDAVGDDGVYDRSLGDLTLSGTTDAEAGQVVTVTFEGQTYTGNVTGGGGTVDAPNTWTVAAVPVAVINALAKGTAFAASATVSDQAGNPADAPATVNVVPYAPADTYMVEVGRPGAHDIRLGIFIDPRSNLLTDAAYALGETLIFTPGEQQYLGGASYNNAFDTLALSFTDTAGVPTGNVIFSGVWVEDEFAGIVAVPNPGDARVQFNLRDLSAGTEVVQISLENDQSTISTTFIGTAGGDTIVATNTDTLIQGRGGDDTINVSAGGVNTIIFEANPVDNGLDTIIGFSVAPNTALPDRIGFAGLTNSNLRGDGTAFQSLAAGETLNGNAGFVVLTTQLGGVDASDLLTAALGLEGEAAGDVIYLLASDGTNAALAQINYTGVDAGNATVMANFTGLGDVSGITADEILGFNALPV